MNHDITKKTIDEIPFIFMRSHVPAAEIADALAKSFVPIFQYATANGIPFAGAPTCRYVSYGPGLVTMEAGMPVVGATDVGDGMILGSLVGGSVVSTYHKGSYDTLHLGHEALQKWMLTNGEESAGSPWEVYITDPAEVPDPAEWITELVHPLK